LGDSLVMLSDEFPEAARRRTPLAGRR